MTKSILLALGLAIASAAPAAAQFGGAAGIGEGEALFARAQSDLEPGAVYVYRDTGDGWTEVAKLTADDGAIGDGFGAFVDVSGTVMIVGAPGAEVVEPWQGRQGLEPEHPLEELPLQPTSEAHDSSVQNTGGR